MNNIDVWGIDIFRISELTNKRPLTAVTYTICKVSSLFYVETFDPNLISQFEHAHYY